MKKTDTRNLKPEVQQEIRRQAVRLHKTGRKTKEVAEIVGAHYVTVCKWIRIFKNEGSKGIQAKKRGRKVGTLRTLSLEQEKELKKAISDKCPDQMKLPFALWTRIAVRQLVKQLWSIDMPIRTVGEYLKRWGFTPQKPLRRAYKQNPKAVKERLDDQYPGIAKRAKNEKAEIHWGDETGLCNDSYPGRSYAPRGNTSAIRLHPRCKRANLISTVTNQGKVRFIVYKDKMNSDTMIKFMERLIKGLERKVFLILDNLKVHHSYIVRDWLEVHKDQIEVFFLPSYSPELNPDEYLNCDLKAGVHSGTPA